MLHRTLAIAVFVLGLAACAAPSPAPQAQQLPWRDSVFGYHPGLVTVSREDLFRLDAEVLEKLQHPAIGAVAASQRLKHLLALVFGADLKRFSYSAGHSTIASETWQLRRGDCLSLTVLTYSVARAMNMAAHMQEVQTPVLFDRRGTLDFVNQHVNVLFRRAHPNLMEDPHARDVVVDFEPNFASVRVGRELTEDAVLARYYNNVAAEHLGGGRPAQAYAHFKAAIQADPGYAASYGNLALLYRNAGLLVEAEQLLRHAVELGEPADVPLRALHQLLMEQGRVAEARGYERQLQARRAQDPYYWIGLGLQYLQDGDYRQAVRALERARGMTGNFDEVRRYLAVAYWRSGQPARANQELSALASQAGGEEGVAKLRSKINSDRRQ